MNWANLLIMIVSFSSGIAIGMNLARHKRSKRGVSYDDMKMIGYIGSEEDYRRDLAAGTLGRRTREER